MNNSLFIIIPVLNRWEQTRQCLEQLFAGSTNDFSVVVVDHGSTDGTREGLDNGFPAVTRLPATTDLWWTGATNLGIRHAQDNGAGLIMLLNNDCYVEHDTIERLMAHHLEHPDSIIAPVHRDLQTGEIISRRSTTLFLLGFPTLLLPGNNLYRPGQAEVVETALTLGGRGTLIPADIFESVGLFNEQDLPHYWADHDFYLRCKRHGIRQYIACDCLVNIDQSTTTIASSLWRMSLKRFLGSLRDRRSHRNLKDLTALFRLHYPIPGLYPFGVFLNLLRYSLLYGIARLMQLGGRGRTTTS